MKFLFHFYDLRMHAGIQRAVSELSNALVEQGHSVTIVSDTARQETAFALDPRIQIVQIPNPQPTGGGLRVWLVKLAGVFRQFTRLRDQIRLAQPDLVVDHGTAIGLLYPFATLGGRPFLLQRHFAVASFPRGAFLYRLLSLFAGRKTVVALTETIADELRAHGYKHVTVIPNPIPSYAQPCPLKANSRRIGLLIGRAGNPQKGFDVFLNALAIRPIPGWQFRIVGPGVDEDPLLAELVRRHCLQDHVKLLAATPDPNSEIVECSCLIMPSRYEGLPMVALEALAIGRPVIGSDVDGLRDLIVPGVNGVLFPTEDPQRLSDTLASFCEKPELADRMAREAPQSVRRFSPEAIAREWLSLAERVCTQRQ
jgi:glycosyltransferase involved in cell wall biosynthesis